MTQEQEEELDKRLTLAIALDPVLSGLEPFIKKQEERKRVKIDEIRAEVSGRLAKKRRAKMIQEQCRIAIKRQDEYVELLWRKIGRLKNSKTNYARQFEIKVRKRKRQLKASVVAQMTLDAMKKLRRELKAAAQ